MGNQGQSQENSENVGKAFLLEEYRDIYTNIIHIENRLFQHMTFFTTLFLGISTASVAIITQLPSKQIMSLKDVVGFLTFPYLLLLVVCNYEIRMTIELRVRKIKFVEGIIKIREYFIDKDKSIDSFILLIKSFSAAPPYLRRQSEDWYQVLYLCLMFSICFLVTWIFAPMLGLFLYDLLSNQPSQFNVIHYFVWIFVGMILTFVTGMLRYRSVKKFADTFDTKREREFPGEYNYTFLDPGKTSK